MESFKIENLSFTYPERSTKALDNVNMIVEQGEFVTLCGKSGCGKTTLLRLLKSTLAPFGEVKGNIFFQGKPLSQYDTGKQAAAIGFVMQNPDNQIVTDKVWHELAFGLESLGFSTPEIRSRVAEMASFFGIQNWFYNKVTDLSGGQKQLLNLASVMVMQPSVLILDEPTSQLDPIAAQEFLKTIEKINRELGTTVILTEHRLEDAFPISDRVIVMDKGRIIADDSPVKVGKALKSLNHDMYDALPTPMRIYGALESDFEYPLTVRDGRAWLEKYSADNKLHNELIPKKPKIPEGETVVEIKDAWFRYDKDLPDVIKGLDLSVKKGELFAVVGGNGTGKSTMLSLVSGLNTAYRGEVLIKGRNISKISGLYRGLLGVLPQNPQSLFVKKTVYLDLMEILSGKNLSKEEKEDKVRNIAAICQIENLLESHPYDLSGGEQQRAALAKVLLLSPEILLLDEPTKGMDAYFKEEFAGIIKNLKSNCVTVIMVSHDIEFCAEYADRCALVFDGSIISSGVPREFFAGKNFYTTSANRMARTRLPSAVIAEDVILACGGEVKEKKESLPHVSLPKEKNTNENKPKQKISIPKIILGSILMLLFFLTCTSYLTDKDILNLSGIKWLDLTLLQLITIVEITGALLCFFPQKVFGTIPVQQPNSDHKLTGRTLLATALILLAIPLTIYVGIYFLGDRKYYFISLLIILEAMLPFCLIFESRKPQARELIVVSVLCAIAVAGRSAFFMLPQFKPVVALVIITGICFGGETGFLVGAVTGFVSNFFFGQGAWTPWQMFAFGIIGFVSGILFKKGLLRKTKGSLCIFGFIVTLLIYGGIMNPSVVFQTQAKPTLKMFIATYISGAPLDLVHAASTAFFLWFISEAMIDKIERIKVKYGLIER